LTHVRALVREFRLNIDEQLAHLVEHRNSRTNARTCVNPRVDSLVDGAHADE